MWCWGSIAWAEPDGCKAEVGQKDTGVQGLPRAVLVIPAVHQRGDHGMHSRLYGLCRGPDSPWAAIVACDELVTGFDVLN